MKKADIGIVVGLILGVFLGILLITFAARFFMLADDVTEDVACQKTLEGLALLEKKTKGFSEESKAVLNEIVNLEAKIKSNCKTKNLKVDYKDKETFYKTIDAQLNDCAKIYYNAENPYFQSTKKNAMMKDTLVQHYNSMFCVVCADIKVKDKFTWSQSDYYSHILSSKPEFSKNFDYIGKYSTVSRKESDLAEYFEYANNFIDFQYQAEDGFTGIFTGLDGYAGVANMHRTHIADVFTKDYINFFNGEFTKNEFDVNNETLSLVLLFNDFNGPRDGDKPVIAVIPASKTYYRSFVSSPYYGIALEYYFLNLIKSYDVVFNQAYSVLEATNPNEVTGAQYQFCTRFSYEDK